MPEMDHFKNWRVVAIDYIGFPVNCYSSNHAVTVLSTVEHAMDDYLLLLVGKIDTTNACAYMLQIGTSKNDSTFNACRSKY